MLSPSGTLQKTFQGSGLEGFAHVGRKGEHGSAEDIPRSWMQWCLDAKTPEPVSGKARALRH